MVVPVNVALNPPYSPLQFVGAWKSACRQFWRRWSVRVKCVLALSPARVVLGTALQPMGSVRMMRGHAETAPIGGFRGLMV
jgi:hypothetical protein